MMISKRKNFASDKIRFSLVHKLSIGSVGILLLLSYYGIIKDSYAHLVAGLAFVLGFGLLKSSFSQDNIDQSN